MALNTRYEGKVYELHPNIISFGSFERDGSFPYVYNNEQAAIMLEALDDDMKITIDNNIYQYKAVMYKDKYYTVPVIKNQIEYSVLNEIAKNNNAKISTLKVLQMYKAITESIDKYGMLMLGFRYDQDNDKTYKFKTIGIRGKFGIQGYQYGVTLWAEALQYDQDSDGNTTINSLVKSDEHFYSYKYDLEYLTIMNTFEYDQTNDKLLMEYKSVEKQPDGSRLLDLDFSLDCDDANAKFDPDKIYKYITMPELNQTVEYSYYHIKTFGDKLSLDTLEHQSNILITL